MRGIIINLLKDVQQQVEDVNQNNRNNYSHLVWTYYDRISIKEIKKTEDYFILSEVRDNWVGGIQSLHLYSDEIDKKFEYLKNNDTSGVLIDLANRNKLNEDAPSFFCVTSFKLNNKIKNIIEWTSKTNAHNVNSLIKEKLDTLLNDAFKNKGLHYEIYNSLGAEDFVIVFVCNSMNTFAEAIELLRRLKFETSEYTPIKGKKEYNLFETTYSFVGQNNINNINAPGLDAMVSISLKNGHDKEEFKKILEKQGIKISEDNGCFGEFDVRFVIKSSKNLMKLYLKGGNLSATWDKYKDYIYQSQTTWLYENKSNFKSQTLLTLEVSKKELEILENLHNKKIYDNSSTKFNSIINSHDLMKHIPHFKEECRILLAEYRRYMNSSFIQQWWVDIELQFDAFTDCLERFLHNSADRQNPTAIKKCMEDLKETYTHVTQASRMFFEIPETTTYYSGSYNNILRAYYGLIRLLIYIGYAIPHDKGSEQSKIAFSINFDVTSKINSRLHLLSKNPSGKKFISFNLPYAALYNMPKYMIYLIHEVFHYISPVNRETRNRLMFKVCLDMMLKNILHIFIQQIVEENSPKFDEKSIEKDKINKAIDSIITSSTIENIIRNCIENILADSKNIPNSMFEKTSEYFVNELEHFIIHENNELHSNIINIMIEIIKECLKSIDSTFESQYIKTIGVAVDKKTWYAIFEIVVDRINSLNNMSDKDFEGTLNKNLRKAINIYDNSSLGKAVVKNIQELCEGLSEAICDMYIINLLGLSFEEYISIFVGLLDDLLFNFENNIDDKTDSLSFRIGILTDIYNTYSEPEEWLKEKIDNWKEAFKPENFQIKACFINSCYEKYNIVYKNYRDIILDYLNFFSTKNLSKHIDNINEWHKSISILQTIYEEYKQINKDSTTKDQRMLELNIKMIEFFQSQIPIHMLDLNKTSNMNLQPDIKFPKRFNNITVCADPVIVDLETYMNEIINAIKDLKENAEGSLTDQYEGGMWFRGVCNYKYGLTPSIFRNVPNNLSLYAYQVALLKETHANTASYPHLWNDQMITCVEQIAFMQHYGVPTNFLDFSLDALTSLHFAANPDSEKDQCNFTDAAVYILHPALFNKAMIALGNKKMSGYYPMLCTSILDSKKLEPFVPSDCSDENVTNEQKKFQSRRHKYHTTYPRAMVVPRTNDRIHIQQGTFVAFPLNVTPDNAGDYGYLDLVKLQEMYLNKFKDGKPFLKKIIINASYLESIRKNLKMIGITSNKLYPELDNLLKNTIGIVNDKFIK